MKRRRRGKQEEVSEELAKARRERARKARADLAAKAKGPKSSLGAKAEAETKSRKRVEKPKDEPKPEDREKRRADREKDREKDEKPKAGGERDRKKDEKPKAGGERDRKKKDEKPKADRKRRGLSRKRGDEKAKPKTSKGGRKRGADAKKAGKGTLVALKDGAKETRARAKKAAPKVGAAALALIVGAFGLFFTGLGFVLRFIGAVYRRVAPPVRTALRVARRVIEAVSRQVTPVRVLALVVAGAAVLLALSQFADYRNISIGNDAYADGIQTVAPAPVRETAETGSAHSYLMVPLAGVALVLLGAALTGRWRLCRLIAVAGIIAILVGLIHDRPTGLDTGDEDLAYTGVKATLLGGFYAQLFSGLLITLSSLLLGRELRLAGARRPARASRGSRARRRLLRRNPRVEGARA